MVSYGSYVFKLNILAQDILWFLLHPLWHDRGSFAGDLRFDSKGIALTVQVSSFLFAALVVLADLLERVVLHLSSSSTDCFFPPAEYKGQSKALQCLIKGYYFFSYVTNLQPANRDTLHFWWYVLNKKNTSIYVNIPLCSAALLLITVY